MWYRNIDNINQKAARESTKIISQITKIFHTSKYLALRKN
jgi:hypothetical protein